MRGFLAEYAQGDVYMEGIERKKEWGSGELADFFQQMAVMTGVAFRAKCKMFSRHLQKPILKTEKGRFKGL